MYHLNVTFSPPKSWITMCGLSTGAGNPLTFSFAVCNNRPVRVIGRAGKRPEITVPWATARPFEDDSYRKCMLFFLLKKCYWWQGSLSCFSTLQDLLCLFDVKIKKIGVVAQKKYILYISRHSSGWCSMCGFGNQFHFLFALCSKIKLV